MTWAYLDCGENKELGTTRGLCRSHTLPMATAQRKCTRKMPFYSVGPGVSTCFFSVATAAYQKGQTQRTKTRAGEIGMKRDRVPEPGRNSSAAALRMGSGHSPQSRDLELGNKVTGYSDTHTSLVW